MPHATTNTHLFWVFSCAYALLALPHVAFSDIPGLKQKKPQKIIYPTKQATKTKSNIKKIIK